MNICILGPRERKKEEIWLIEEAKNVFDKVLYASIPSVRIESRDTIEVLAKNIRLSDFDCLLPRIPRTYMNYGYMICKLLEDRIFMPNKPESIIITHNKFLTLLALDSERIAVPKTYLASTRDVMESALRDIRYPAVIKVLYGSLGKGVMFADSKGSATSLLDTFEAMKQPLFVEEYIPEGKEDIRVVVVGNETVATMKRIATKGERRANIGIGGVGRKMELTGEMRLLALRVARALDLGICGIDIIDEKRPKVVEANVNLNFEGVTNVTGVNVARTIINYMKRKTERWMER